jgi:hypothetical protein
MKFSLFFCIFLPTQIELGTGDAHKNLLDICGFCPHGRSKSDSSLASVNDFHPYLPHLLTNVEEIRYK